MFDEAFLMLRVAEPTLPLVTYETPFGDMVLPMSYQHLAKSVSITKRGKLDVRYQLMPEQKKQVKNIVKDICKDSEVRREFETALRSLITKCVALDTPKQTSSQLPTRYHPIQIKVGK